MARKILRRCDICGRFHASYRVPGENDQPRYYCYDCWKSQYGSAKSQSIEEKKFPGGNANSEENS